jgi:hypothetical protein
MKNRKTRLRPERHVIHAGLLAVSLGIGIPWHAFAETVSESRDEGTFSLHAEGHVGIVVSARIVPGRVERGWSRVALLLNKSEITTFFPSNAKRDVESWAKSVETTLSKGEHRIRCDIQGDWLRSPTITVFAWREEGREIPDFLAKIISGIDQAVTVKDRQSGRLLIDTVRSLKTLLLARISHLENRLWKIDAETANASASKKRLEAEIGECRDRIDRNRSEAERLEERKKPWSERLERTRQELAYLEYIGATRQEIDAKKKEVAYLDEEVRKRVREIEILHVAVYNDEERTERNTRKIAEIDDALVALGSETDALLRELEERRKDLAMTDAIIQTKEDEIERIRTPAQPEPDVIVVEKKEKTDFATTFGIACIPALAIALPVAAGAGIAYTELTREKKEEPTEDDSEKGESEPSMRSRESEKNLTIIRNLDQSANQYGKEPGR